MKWHESMDNANSTTPCGGTKALQRTQVWCYEFIAIKLKFRDILVCARDVYARGIKILCRLIKVRVNRG